MSEQIKLEDFHGRIVVDTFAGQSLNDQDYFLLFCLLHNYKIAVTPGVLDRTDLMEIHALTQRGAAAVVAVLWKITEGKRSNGDDSMPQAEYTFWYLKWNADWEGNKHFAHLSEEETKRLLALKLQLLEHPMVSAMTQEDDET